MNIARLLSNIKATEIDVKILRLRLNSNAIKKGDLFIALQGENTHGSAYIKHAIDNGCAMILTDKKHLKCTVPVLSIDNLKQHLPTLAARFYPHAQKLKLIGITGTNGKTSVGFFIHQLLDFLGIKNAFIGTLSPSKNEINHTTPDIFTLYDSLNQYYLAGIDTVVLEVSSHALAQNRVAGLDFEQAIFTNLSQDHLDYHQTMENYRLSKTQLFAFKSTKSALINSDDASHSYFLDAAKDKPQTLYSTDEFIQASPNENGFLCQLDDFVFELSLLGKFNLSNVLAAFHSVEKLGFTREEIIPLLPKLRAPIGRMHKISEHIWVDYAHTADALSHAINALKLHYPTTKISLVFGCGGNRDKDKRAQMGRLASQLADTIIITNDNPRNENPQQIIDDILSGISNNFTPEIIPDRRLAIETALADLAENSENQCLLIAGKGHETTQQFADETIALSDIDIIQNALL